MAILGIETSCDDTGVAVYEAGQGVLIHRLSSQIALHQPYGGVVPELAARDHIRTLLPSIRYLLQEEACAGHSIDGIAYTAGPGLAGALLVGAAVGRSLALAWDIPAIGVHHMEGHLLAPMLEEEAPDPPFVALLVSGGHTLLVDVTAIGHYRILGQSLDDAAGEAFDKTAKLLGLPYPGGPSISKAAEQGKPGRFHFPRPMTDRPGLDFSFSGLKTFALNTASKHTLDDQTVADIALAFQDAVVETLAIKCRRALRESGCTRLIVAGGVGANQQLRARLREIVQQEGGEVFYPRPEFCTDNGAMIAYAGWVRLQAGQQEPVRSPAFNVRPRWLLTDISPLP